MGRSYGSDGCDDINQRIHDVCCRSDTAHNTGLRTELLQSQSVSQYVRHSIAENYSINLLSIC